MSAFRVTVYESNVWIQGIQNSGEASNTSHSNNPECRNATTAIQLVCMSDCPVMEIHRSLDESDLYTIRVLIDLVSILSLTNYLACENK